MAYILLIITIIASASQGVFQKQYNVKNGKKANVMLFSLVTIFATLLFFVASSGLKLNFSTGLMPYSLAFGIVYAMAILGGFLAIQYGSFALSTLINSYSLIIPTVYGIAFLHEDLKAFGYLGMGFLVISLFLINAKGENVKFSFKWIISVIVAFVGNGMCSTVQRIQQIRFDGKYKSEFMILALMLVVAALVVYEIIKKDDIKSQFKECVKFGIPKGAANGVVNLLVMVSAPLIPISILFPSISAGGIITTYALSKLVYKEKLTLMQTIGFVFGIAAIVLLNL